MGGWVGPEGFYWEFAPSEAPAAEPSKWGTSYWLKKNGLRVQLLPQRGVVGASTGRAAARGLCASPSAVRGRKRQAQGGGEVRGGAERTQAQPS